MTDQHVDDSRRRGAESFAEDRFDHPPKGRRVGVHRIVAKPRRFWVFLVAALVGVALLTGAGIFAVNNIGGEIMGAGETSEKAPAVEQTAPVLDPEATIAVLNGTVTPGLEASVAQTIVDNEWGQIGFTEVAASNEVQISAVFYTSVTDEAAALGLAAELGGVSTYQSNDYTQYGVQLVVLLGSDYAGPGVPDPAG